MSLSAQIVWDGDTDTDFANGANWVGDAAPTNDTATDTAAFNGAAANQPDLSTGDRGVLGIAFQSSGWTLSGSNVLSVGAGGITSTGNNAITAQIAQSGAATYSSATGGQLNLDVITGGPVTFGSDGNTGEVVLNGTADNASFSPIVAFGTVTLNKGDGSPTGDFKSSTNNVTLNAGATIKFGSNLTSRADGGGRGQIYGTATVNGTLDLNGQGLTRDDTFNWSMGGLSGNGVVTNNGTGSAELGIVAGGTFSGIIQDGTSVTSLYVKGGNFNITNTNTYSGGTTIDGVQVNLGGNGTDRLGSGAITLVNGGYFKNSNSNQTLNNDIVLGTGGGGVEVGWNNKNIRLNGVVSGDGDFHIRNDSSFTRITGNNTYTGDTLIQGSVNTRSNGLGTGVITLDDVDGIAGNTRGFLQNFEQEATLNNDLVVSANGGHLKAGWNADLIITGEVSGSGQLTIQGDSGTNRLTNAGNSFSGNIYLAAGTSRLAVASLGSGTYSGIISGLGNFEYSGSGIQTLVGDNLHTGTTTVSSGTLLINGDQSAATGATTVASGAAIGGDGIIGGDMTILAGGLLQFSLTETLTVLGTVSLDSTFGIDDLVGISSGTADGTYTLIDNASDFSGIENFGLGNAFDLGSDKSAYFQNGSLQVVVFTVPEPSAALLGGLGILALLRRRRD